jgi:hypothetical protein
MQPAIFTIALCALCAPALACSSSSKQDEQQPFSFGAPEMEAAAGGDWVGEIELAGAAQTGHQLHLDYSPAHNHPACESRTLNDPMCVTTSSMGFVGTLSSDDKKFDSTPVHATFEVLGEHLTSGFLSIDTGSVLLNADFVQGAFTAGKASENGAPIGTFTLRRE